MIIFTNVDLVNLLDGQELVLPVSFHIFSDSDSRNRKYLI